MTDNTNYLEEGSSPMKWGGRDSRRDLRHERFRDYDDHNNLDHEPQGYWDRRYHQRQNKNVDRSNSRFNRKFMKRNRDNEDGEWSEWESHRNY